jgi:hypothetical protein
MCVDSTHDTNEAGFKLINVVVPDEYGEGIVVAWCIASGESEYMVKAFLEAVKNNIGLIAKPFNPLCLMSDYDDSFKNAMVKVNAISR